MLDKDCTIDLEPGAKPPVGKRCILLTLKQDEGMREWQSKNLDRGFIRKSQSPYGAPCFFVRKAEWTKESCLLPWTQMVGAFELLRVKVGHEAKTAFLTKYGQYEFLVMPFGLAMALVEFAYWNAVSHLSLITWQCARAGRDCLIAISTATIQYRTSSHQADGRNGQKMSVLRRRGWVSKVFNTRSFQAKLTEVIGEGQLQQFLIEENIGIGDTMWEEFDDGQQDLVVENRVPSPP
ncbi:hypothetical protein MP228_007844 [Amoeboaphelidium protococcarum]|nr:hypothetical protein MP228_007844 [Amoeboaphelidium protococcarum]